jgi:hypothetical protein
MTTWYAIVYTLTMGLDNYGNSDLYGKEEKIIECSLTVYYTKLQFDISFESPTIM